MEIIRAIKKVVNHQVVVDVPKTFEDKEVKVFVFSHTPQNGDSSLSQLLLKGPTWSKEKVQEFEAHLKEGYSNWNLNDF